MLVYAFFDKPPTAKVWHMLASINGAYLGLFFMFAAHRLLTFGYLSDALPRGFLPAVQAMAVGLSSDFWIASLLSLCSFGLSAIARLVVPGLSLAFFSQLLLWLVGLSLCLHLPYVAFFHMPLIPQHLSYFYDPAFIRASWTSVLDPLSWLCALLFFVLVRACQMACQKYGPAKTHPRLFFSALLFFALFGHVAHIRYKVQWFIPEPLQANVIENLYVQANLRHTPEPFSAADLALLEKHFQVQGKDLLRQVVLPAAYTRAEQTGPGWLDAYRHELTRLISVKKSKPIILTLVMESLRSVDSASLGGTAPSLTPHLDTLSQKGILFTSAWSTGTVTRAGQEAVWCGYLSAVGRSLMRERPELHLGCLPRFLEQGSTFWFHGGEGRFDNQVAFWQNQGVSSVLSQPDFDPNSPRTDWGLGDYSFLEQAAKKIALMQEQSQAGYLFGMLLTVSNHIPWQLPADADASVKNFAFAKKHPSEQTVLYADFALGHFVERLRAAQLWQNCLLIIVGDHGIKAPPLQDLAQGLDQNVGEAEQATHVPLLLSGGITEAVLHKQGLAALSRDEAVSQADIAAFYAALLAPAALEAMMAEPLFTAKRQRPVVADLGTTVFFPELGLELGLLQALHGKLNPEQAPGQQAAVLYYRALLQALVTNDLWPKAAPTL